MRRRTRLNKTSSRLVDYLVNERSLTQSDIALILKVDKSFISRVRAGEREFSPTQMSEIADELGVPMGAMLVAATPPVGPRSAEREQLVKLCERLMQQADEALVALRAQRSK